MKKVNIILIACCGIILLLSGCETFKKMDQAIGRNQVRIKKFFARLFLFETESINFAVRIRHEFFVYLPPIDESQNGVDELSTKMMANLTQSRIDNLINKELEKEAEVQGVEDLKYLETDKYRIFIEPRFISFEYCEGTPPVFAMLNKGLYALSMQSQIIIRDKRNGSEVWRKTVTVKNDANPHILMDFAKKDVFHKSIKKLSSATAKEILQTLKDRKPILASKERYALIYQP